jgi:hypothetical protein
MGIIHLLSVSGVKREKRACGTILAGECKHCPEAIL